MDLATHMSRKRNQLYYSSLQYLGEHKKKPITE